MVKKGVPDGGHHSHGCLMDGSASKNIPSGSGPKGYVRFHKGRLVDMEPPGK